MGSHVCAHVSGEMVHGMLYVYIIECLGLPCLNMCPTLKAGGVCTT